MRSGFYASPVVGEIRQLRAELSLISHTSAVNLEGKASRSSDEDIGGKRPPGSDRETPNRRDVDEFGAYLASYHRRTPEYIDAELAKFRRRWEKCADDESESQKISSGLLRLRDECREALMSWRRRPQPKGDEPQSTKDSHWGLWVSLSPLDGGTLARRYGVTRQYIHLVRKAYREGGLVPLESVLQRENEKRENWKRKNAA